jgi:hypothetical protein
VKIPGNYIQSAPQKQSKKKETLQPNNKIKKKSRKSEKKCANKKYPYSQATQQVTEESGE